MKKEETIDNKGLNQLIKLCNNILKKVYLLILILILYISVVILNKLNIINLIKIILKLLAPLFIGIFLAWLLRPIINYLEQKSIKRIIALSIVYIIIFLIFIFGLILFIPKFISNLLDFFNVFPIVINDFFNNITFIDITRYKEDFFDMFNTLVKNIGALVPNTLANVIKGISTIIISFVIAFYMLITNSLITINASIKKDTYMLIMKINSILRNYIKCIFLSSLVIFFLTTAIFCLMKLDNPIFLGFICGVTNIIPFIGPYIGAIIPTLIAFTKSIYFGIILVVIIFIIQTLEGNIIQPLIISKNVKIHPIISIISLLVFGYFFGIIGMIFAIPVVSSIKEIYLYLQNRYNSTVVK